MPVLRSLAGALLAAAAAAARTDAAAAPRGRPGLGAAAQLRLQLLPAALRALHSLLCGLPAARVPAGSGRLRAAGCGRAGPR
jgi:hypothetical protein